MRIRLNLFTLSAIVLAIIVMILVYYLLHMGTTQQNAQALPHDVRYALEYFNAMNSNSTILVPSEYYNAALSLAINGNHVIQNDYEYAQMLLANKDYNNTGFVLIDMAQLNNLYYLEYLSKTSNFSIINFSANFVSGSFGSSYKNCSVASSRIDLFAICQLSLGNTVLGYENVISLPNSNSFSIVNESILYNGYNSSYVYSDISLNSSGLIDGAVFLYKNVTTLYLPQNLLDTFYGREMFSPYYTLNNVLDNYGEARVIRLV